MTQRGRERAREDHDFTPVIVKRIDMSRRHADDILEHTIKLGLEQLKRPPRSLALSAVAGGLVITFSVMAVAVMETAVVGQSDAVRRIATALVYPLGFMVCIMASMELFTEHTATAVYPVLDKRSHTPRLLRLWVVVLLGNLVGAFAGSVLLALSEPVVHAREGYLAVAQHVLDPAGPTMFTSAVLAGCLMALGAWLVHATPPDWSQLVVVYLVTFLIGLGGLHHSIAGSAELFTGLLVGSGHGASTVVGAIATIATGNLVGGSVFVALLTYGHVRQSQTVERKPSSDQEE